MNLELNTSGTRRLGLEQCAWRLRSEVAALSFEAPITHVYNPLEYAWEPHRRYLQRYGRGHPEVVLVGMNPGPWGMAQTGVPFGDVEMVRDWMGIEGRVDKPDPEHPKRPVKGFDCHRREVSGRRLWGWAKAIFESPERFFQRFFVLNYCPLCFLEASGRNRTPDQLPASERQRLFPVCDAALSQSIACLRPRYVLGVGRFAAARAASSLAGSGVTIAGLPHPSPASPAANRGWVQQMEAALARAGIRPRLLGER